MEINSHISTSGTNKSYKSFLNTNCALFNHIISATTSNHQLAFIVASWCKSTMESSSIRVWDDRDEHVGNIYKVQIQTNITSIFKIDFIYEERKTQIYKKKLTN